MELVPKGCNWRLRARVLTLLRLMQCAREVLGPPSNAWWISSSSLRPRHAGSGAGVPALRPRRTPGLPGLRGVVLLQPGAPPEARRSAGPRCRRVPPVGGGGGARAAAGAAPARGGARGKQLGSPELDGAHLQEHRPSCRRLPR